MEKFEYGLAGVMAFLILGILGMIATSPDSAPVVEAKESLGNVEGPSSEPEAMGGPAMSHTHEIIIPKGTGVPGCEMTSECYVPSSVVVTSGHTVTWINEDTVAHTVTSGTFDEGPDGVFDSNIFVGGATFERTFEEPGNYDYFCVLHPWMTGTVGVA